MVPPTIIDFLLTQLRKAQKLLDDFSNSTKPTPKPVPNNNRLNAMLLAIQKHEGYYVGSRSYRNKNPGNLRFASQARAVGKDKDNFAIFATYEDGFQALKNMVLNAARGGSKIYNPEMTLIQFFGKYAPKADSNDPTQYACIVAKAMNVDPYSYRLKDIL